MIDYEIVQLVDGRLFDVESYELASAPEALTRSAPGYYLLYRPFQGGHEPNEPVIRFVGPFPTAAYANSALGKVAARMRRRSRAQKVRLPVAAVGD